MAGDLASEYFRVIVALSALSTLAVFLRYLARWSSRMPIGMDDVWILVAWIFLVGLNVNAGFSRFYNLCQKAPSAELSSVLCRWRRKADV